MDDEKRIKKAKKIMKQIERIDKELEMFDDRTDRVRLLKKKERLLLQAGDLLQ